MVIATLETNKWEESAEPMISLETDLWDFDLTPHPEQTLETDRWFMLFAGTLPAFSPSIVAAVARVQQGLAFPEFIMGGIGGEIMTVDYDVAAASFSPETLDGDAIELTLDDDEVSAEISLPFSFSFYDRSFTKIFIGSNGLVGFDNTNDRLSDIYYNGITLPENSDENTPPNAIFLFWEDLFPPSGGTIKYETFGLAGSRIFVINYEDIPQYGNETELLTIQLKLFESDNHIEIHTTHASSVGNTESGQVIQGIQNRDGTKAAFYAGRNFGTDLILDNDAVSFTRNISFSPYALFKKDTSYTFGLWRSKVYKIGEPFKITKMIIPLSSAIAQGREFVPILHFDDDSSLSVGNFVNDLNYPDSPQVITLTPDNFNFKVVGINSFFLEIKFTGSQLLGVTFPVLIEYEKIKSET